MGVLFVFVPSPKREKKTGCPQIYQLKNGCAFFSPDVMGAF